jgi:hypothetical protein
MKLRNTLICTVISAFSSVAFAGPKCTEEAKDKWKNETEFQKSLTDQGFKIKKFKVTSGNCYEIYGWDKDGKKVEIYFNPITGDKVKEEVESK